MEGKRSEGAPQQRACSQAQRTGPLEMWIITSLPRLTGHTGKDTIQSVRQGPLGRFIAYVLALPLPHMLPPADYMRSVFPVKRPWGTLCENEPEYLVQIGFRIITSLAARQETR